MPCSRRPVRVKTSAVCDRGSRASHRIASETMTASSKGKSPPPIVFLLGLYAGWIAVTVVLGLIIAGVIL